MTVAECKYVTEGNQSGFLSERTDTKESTCILRAALNADGMTKCKDNCYELPSAFCQQLEMQMEEQALRVRAVRSGPGPVLGPARGPAFLDLQHEVVLCCYVVLHFVAPVYLDEHKGWTMMVTNGRWSYPKGDVMICGDEGPSSCHVMEKCGTAVATGSRGPDANALAMHQFTGVPAGSRVGCQVGLPS